MEGKKRLLFGTAFSVVLPNNVQDVSTLRQIPDNQEVFCHPVTDQSFVIELLEAVPGTDEQALRTHFDDLASSNDASGDCEILGTEEIPVDKTAMGECSSIWYMTGRQKVSKFNESVKNTVNIHMGLLRLQEHTTDIIISFNDPVEISPESSSFASIPTSTDSWQVDDFLAALTSMQLLDAGIFN